MRADKLDIRRAEPEHIKSSNWDSLRDFPEETYETIVRYLAVENGHLLNQEESEIFWEGLLQYSAMLKKIDPARFKSVESRILQGLDNPDVTARIKAAAESYLEEEPHEVGADPRLGNLVKYLMVLDDIRVLQLPFYDELKSKLDAADREEITIGIANHDVEDIYNHTPLRERIALKNVFPDHYGARVQPHEKSILEKWNLHEAARRTEIVDSDRLEEGDRMEWSTIRTAAFLKILDPEAFERDVRSRLRLTPHVMKDMLLAPQDIQGSIDLGVALDNAYGVKILLEDMGLKRDERELPATRAY